MTFGTAFSGNRRFYENPLFREPNYILMETLRNRTENRTLINLRAPFEGLFPAVLELFQLDCSLQIRIFDAVFIGFRKIQKSKYVAG